MSSPETPRFSRRTLLAGGASGVALAGLAAFFCKRLLRSAEELAPEAAAPQATVETSQETLPQFIIDQYVPPPQGVIIKKPVIYTPGGKTVLLIADEHPLPDVHPKDQPELLNAQKELYQIVLDLIKKYKKIPVVQEAWVKGRTVEDVKNVDPRSTAQEEFAIYEIPRVLANIPDPEERARHAEALIGTNNIPALMLLMAAYQEELVMLGSVTPEELFQTTRAMNDVSYASEMKEHAGDLLCSDTRLTLKQAVQKFKEHSRDSGAIDCYCSALILAENARRAFHQDRLLDAPRREIEAALASMERDDFVVVVAGNNHLKEALRILDENKVNHLVVAPKSIAAESMERTFEPITMAPFFDDDAKGTCREHSRKALLQWLESEE